jgi:hypothetical protein
VIYLQLATQTLLPPNQNSTSVTDQILERSRGQLTVDPGGLLIAPCVDPRRLDTETFGD